MCGIVGIYLKNPELRPRLGEIFSPMLMEMTDRGPDSSGVAVYREDDAAQSGKVIAYDPEPGFDWDGAAARVAGIDTSSEMLAKAAEMPGLAATCHRFAPSAGNR